MNEISEIVATWNGLVNRINDGTIKVHHGFECRDCYNSGFREIDDPQGRIGPDGSVYRGVVRCNRCEYWNRRSQQR